MQSNKTRLLVAFAVFILIFSVLTLVYWDFVRQTIVIPIYYLGWLTGLIINSIPQQAWLGLLAVLALITGLDTLKHAQDRPLAAAPDRNIKEGVTRYRTWVNLTRLSFSSDFARQRFATQTRNLILSILSYQEGLNLAETEQKVIRSEIKVPASVRDLVQQRQLVAAQPPGNRIFTGLKRWLRVLTRRKPSDQEMRMDRQIEEIILFIEGLLEINHDRNQPNSQN